MLTVNILGERLESFASYNAKKTTTKKKRVLADTLRLLVRNFKHLISVPFQRQV